LENKVVELHIVDRASDSTIGRTLKKTLSSPIADSNGSRLCKKAQDWRPACVRDDAGEDLADRRCGILRIELASFSGAP